MFIEGLLNMPRDKMRGRVEHRGARSAISIRADMETTPSRNSSGLFAARKRYLKASRLATRAARYFAVANRLLKE